MDFMAYCHDTLYMLANLKQWIVCIACIVREKVMVSLAKWKTQCNLFIITDGFVLYFFLC